MSSDWPEVSLESLKAGTKSAFAMGPFGSKIKAENFVKAGVPVIKGGNLGGTYLSETSFDFLTQEKASELASSKAGRLDIVVTHRGTLGQVGLIPESSKYEQYVVSQSQLKMSFDTEKVDPYYVYYFLRSPLGQSRLLANTSQVGVPAIAQALTTIRQLQIPLPPRDSQTEITATLRALDDRISLLRETNATLEAIAQALFKSWFVDFDPVRAKMEGRTPEGMDEATAALFPDGFETSELGEVPRGWQATDLAELTSKSGGSIQTGPFGSQLHASDYVEVGIPVVMPKDISLRRVQTESIARVSPIDADRLARHQLAPGDVVFSRRGDVEKHALISETERGWLCGTGCLLVRPGPKWPSPNFLSLLLDLPQSRLWLVRHAVGATMPNLNTGILGSVPVVMPSREVVTAFEEIVSGLEARRAHNAEQAQTLSTLRDTLLPRLISGQLRLPDAQAATEAALDGAPQA
ncbi:MAG: restriction endonuclease subunit S [Giesbergeria sp.]|jgi:type I restriction enzyme S subunit|nr:restriction endonuclease subunit S [Giesbergeria sp.]